MATIRFDWKFYVGLLATVAGVVVPVFLWQIDLSSRSLSVRLVSSVALQPEAATSVQDLQVLLDGVKLESPYLSTLELINDGSKSVSASDFESPIEIALNQDCQVVRARISGTQPSGIPGVLVGDKSVVKLQPLLLNPKDAITLAIITSGGTPIFAPRARIAGVPKISFENATRDNDGWKRAAFLLPLSVLSCVLYVFYSLCMIRPNAAKMSRPVAFATMLTSLILSSISAQYGLRAIGLEGTTLSILALATISFIIAVSIFVRLARGSRLPSDAV